MSEDAVNLARYAIVIEPLSAEDGGGFLATVPDLPGCISDGEAREEAVQCRRCDDVLAGNLVENRAVF